MKNHCNKQLYNVFNNTHLKMDKYYVFSAKTNNCGHQIINDSIYVPIYTEHEHNNIKYYGCALDSDYLGWRYDLRHLKKLGSKIVTISDFIEIGIKNSDGSNDPVQSIKINDQEFKITSWKKFADTSTSKFFDDYYIQIFIFDKNTSGEDIVKCLHQHLINSTEFDSECADNFKFLKTCLTAMEHYEKFKKISNISDQINWNQYVVFDTKNQIIRNK